MGLTDAEFSQVRRAMRLPGFPAEEDPTGKRRSARWSVDGIVAFAPCREPGLAGAADAEAAARWVNLIDLSPTGASILSKAQLAPGEAFVLALPADHDQHLAAVCVVQYSRVKLDGSFRVGAEFCAPREAGQRKVEAALGALRAMGLYVIEPAGVPAPTGGAAGGAARPQPKPRQSQRRAERRLADGRAIIHTYDESGEPGPVEEVPALDFSATGVCIFRREPLKVGEQFMARVPLADASPIISLCRVTNVAACEGENRYRIGAEFIRNPGITTRIARRLWHWFRNAA
jgi:hypothetical protein